MTIRKKTILLTSGFFVFLPFKAFMQAVPEPSVEASVLSAEAEVSQDAAVTEEVPVEEEALLEVARIREEPEAQFSLEEDEALSQNQYETDYEEDVAVPRRAGVFVEGELGGGYPGYFTGRFSLNNENPLEPFEVVFFHDSANGYGRHHSASDGFFDTATTLFGKKTLLLGDFDVVLSGNYDLFKYGLQSHEKSSFYDMTYQHFTTDDSITWNIPNSSIFMQLSTFGAWYLRYAGLQSDADSAKYTSAEKKTSSLNITPAFRVGLESGGISLGLNASYEFESWLTELDVLHRGEFSLDGGWQDGSLHVLGKAGVVVGNRIGDAMPVVPFGELDFEGAFPMGNYGRDFVVQGFGGLSSSVARFCEIEPLYRFSTLESLPGESSDVFFLTKAAIPLLEEFTFNALLEFRKSVFGNGVWEADYATMRSSGLYNLGAVERTLFDTGLTAVMEWGVWNFGLDFMAHWIYVPAKEYKFSLAANATVTSPSERYTAHLRIKEGMGPGVDFTPIITISGAYKMKDMVSLALSVDDVVKLCTGSDRIFAGSEYYARSGSITFLIQFSF